MAKIRVAVIQPGAPPQIREVEDDLATWQALVRGDIELIELERPGLFAYVNDEAKLEGMMPNFLWAEGQDMVVGPAIVHREDGQGGEASITDEDIPWINERFRFPRRLAQVVRFED